MWKEGNMGTGMDIPEPKKNENEEVKSKKSEKKFLKKGVQKDNEPVGTQHPMPGVIEWKKEKKEYASLNERIIGNGATKLRELEVKYPSLVSSLEELNKPGISRQDFFAIVENFNSINMKEKSGSYDMIHITGEYGDITVKYYENGSASISASYPGSDSLEKPEKAEEKKEPEKSEAEKITEEFGKKRARVLEAHQKLMEAQKNNAFDGAFLEIEFEKAEEEYKKFAGIYGKKMLEEKMKFLEEEKGLEKGTSDYEQSLASLKSEIFRSTVVGYNDQLFKQAFEKAKPKEKGIIGKLAGFFTKTKTRVVIFTAAALFFAPTATLAGAALLGSAKAFQKIYGKRLAGFKGRETEKMCKEFVSGLGRLESEKDWRDYIEYFSNEYYGKLLKFRKKNIFSMFLGNKDLTEGSSLDDKLKPEKKK